MCRMFGFRSPVPSAVHRALVEESNALRQQSREHPDGWGLAWYADGRPRIAKGVSAAFDDDAFEQTCQFVSSETVVAHVRRASVGQLVPENTHPFSFEEWVFAHNGHLPGFERKKEQFEAAIAPRFREALHGDTDSERVFGLFLSALEQASGRSLPLASQGGLASVIRALEQTWAFVEEACADEAEAPALNFVVTNGRLLAACRQGRPLHFATHKVRCPERDTCPAFAPRCEAPSEHGDVVSHLIVSSEPLGEGDVWRELPERSLVAVDAEMRLHRQPLGPPRVDLRPVTTGGVA